MSKPREIVYKRPVEVMDGARPASLGSVSASIAVATLVLLVFGSRALLAWANDLPIGPVSDFLLFVTQWWHDEMTAIGVARLADALREAFRAFEALRW